jgi:hypothetical protein
VSSNPPASLPDSFRDWDAAYVLGALGPDDRRTFELHLATCDACTAAVAELAGLPGMLSKLDVDSATALIAPNDDHLGETVHEPDLVQRLARAERRRKRRVRIGWLSGAAVLTAALVVSGVSVATLSTPQRPTTSVSMTQVVPNAMSADLTVTAKHWGTRFDWNCAYARQWDSSGEHSYDLVVVDKSGVETTVATWSAYGEKAGDLSASTSIPTVDIRRVIIRPTGSTEPLVETSL